MRIIEAIKKIDTLKHNTYGQPEKIEWLSVLDGKVKEMMDAYEGDPVEFFGYNEHTDLDTVLLIPEPYTEVYLRWLEAQIDYYNGEYKKYNNAILMYNAEWKSFVRWYNRTHMPKGHNIKYF